MVPIKKNFFNHKIYNSFGSLPCLKPKISKKNMNNAKLIKMKYLKKLTIKVKFWILQRYSHWRFII